MYPFSWQFIRYVKNCPLIKALFSTWHPKNVRKFPDFKLFPARMFHLFTCLAQCTTMGDAYPPDEKSNYKITKM
jgi:hypothetical protein